ncbi:MAG: LLM class oxidoreductase [Pseudomonadota bacterium]
MTDHATTGFAPMNAGFNATFKPGQLSVGLVAPLEAYAVGAAPSMAGHIARIQLAERLGFSAIWLRDVPFNVPSFGDVGQMFDPFVYLGALAASTERIALGVGSIILPLRHPAHVAKAAASADVLSGGRLLLGVASGDRPEEYPAMNMSFADRGDRFRDSMAYMRAVARENPHHDGTHGRLDGHIDILPKPVAGPIPMLITGGSRQSPDWVAGHGDGWITYPRDATSQGRVIAEYRARVAAAGKVDKPVMQSLYVDLLDDPNSEPRPIHLGFQSGTAFLLAYLQQIQALGVNHVALNLRFNAADIDATLHRIADHILPHLAPQRSVT